jgi:hypothetical protein
MNFKSIFVEVSKSKNPYKSKRVEGVAGLHGNPANFVKTSRTSRIVSTSLLNPLLHAETLQ